jgi:hypothetical protein
MPVLGVLTARDETHIQRNSGLVDGSSLDSRHHYMLATAQSNWLAGSSAFAVQQHADFTVPGPQHQVFVAGVGYP